MDGCETGILVGSFPLDPGVGVNACLRQQPRNKASGRLVSGFPFTTLEGSDPLIAQLRFFYEPGGNSFPFREGPLELRQAFVSGCCGVEFTGIRRPGKVKPSAVSLKQIGIWTGAFERQPASRVREAGAELEKLGYGAIWFSEGLGREAFTQAALLLAGTSRILVATGIANIYGRDPFTMAAGQKTLSEAYPNRFLLGLGVSHIPLVEELRGHSYEKPVAKMSTYLDAMDDAPYESVTPASTSRVIAALGPRMLQLAAKRADGAHPYNVSPEHTATARQVLGTGPLLCPEQAVVLETNPAKARDIARKFLKLYLTLPNYTNNFLRLGFSSDDCKNGGSDRLVDAIVAWGDLDEIRNRIRAHQSAGADHVCIQALTANPNSLPLQEWRELASALIERA